LDELRDSSDDAWQDMKGGFDQAWDNISNAFERAKARFN
jgi:hypothetical protein